MSDDLRETIRETMNEARTAEAAPETIDATPAPNTGAADVGPAGEHAALNQAASVDSSEQPPAGGRFRDSSGKFVKAEASKVPAPKPAEQTATPAPKPAQEVASPTPIPQTGEQSQAKTPQLKPPGTWRDIARDKWAATPIEVQREITKREFDMDRGMKESAAIRDAISPFEGHIRATGGDVTSAVKNMLEVGYVLETGSPQRRAGMLARMAKSAGVSEQDLAMALDELGGHPQAQGQTQPQHIDPEAIARQAEERVFKRFQAQQHQRIQEKTSAEIASFGETHEFFEQLGPGEPAPVKSVRWYMAVLQSAAAQSGSTLTLEDAYNQAVELSPDTAPVLKQRRAATAATSSPEATQRARAAASSVKSQPASISGSSGDGDSVRDTLRSVIAESRRR